MEELKSHAWPGNVRELRNRIERAVALSPGPWIMPGDLFPDRTGSRGGAAPRVGGLEAVRDEAEKREILRALHLSGGVINEAAGMLGISRTTMWEKMRRYRIDATAGGRSEIRT
jgi:transcriptional regulator of acetoin/glycerol metabolism